MERPKGADVDAARLAEVGAMRDEARSLMQRLAIAGSDADADLIAECDSWITASRTRVRAFDRVLADHARAKRGGEAR